MTSAVASNLLVPTSASSSPATACGWLGPRVSFSGRDAPAAIAAEHEETAVASTSPVPAAVATPAISKDFIDFEFSSFGGCATSMLPADELFADGKLLPLRKAEPAAAPEPEASSAAPPPARSEAMPAALPTDQTMKPLRAAAAAAATADQYVFSPKAPSCSSRWRELLGLKRASSASQSPRPSPSPSALAKTPGRTTTTGSSSAARSLKFLLQRSNNNSSSNGGRASSDLASAPLLRDSSDSEASLSLASSRFSLSSSSSSSGGHDHDDIVINPRFSLDSGADLSHPPRLRLVRSSGRRHSTSTSGRRGPSPPPPPPQPRCLSVDSPRMNSSGKIVFQQSPLERSCSSPCSFHHAAAASKSRSTRAAVDRSYSSGGVRVAPVVLNVPVCSRPVLGFFKDKQKDSSAANSKVDSTASARASRTSSTLGRKAAPPPQQQRWSGELPKLCSG